MSSKISHIILEKLNSAFLNEKLEDLNTQPVVLKNLPKGLLGVAGEILINVSEKSFDIVILKNQDFEKVVEKYKNGRSNRVEICVTQKFSPKCLVDNGFVKVKRVWNQGEYSFLGDVLIVWAFNSENPVRISLFGNIVEKIDFLEKETFQKLNSVKKLELFFNKDIEIISYDLGSEKYPYPLVFLSDEYLQSDFGYSNLDFGFRNIPSLDYYLSNKSVLLKVLDDFLNKGYQIICSSKNIRGIKDFLKEREYVLTMTPLNRGFVSSDLKILVLSDYELFGKVNLVQGDWLRQIIPGDFVVHEDHGIGIVEKIIENSDDTYIEIRYASKDRLLVPLSQSKKITRYVGGKGRIPTLTTLNSGSWKRVKTKLKTDTQILAKELLQIYAMREVLKFEFSKSKKILKQNLQKFVQDFEFEDTHDQILATQEILNDIVSSKLMDRLLVGDVGFGKTELAMRAAFLTVEMGMQVVLLAPTTILVEQHLAVFRDRFKKYGLNLKGMSRFLDSFEKKEILKELESGEIDIVIGTHSLLHDIVRFKNLGLIIIDEEQKFGVKQKEKLKQKRLQTHVLSMSATPIPRSLGMSLSGIRDISTLFSPPEGRKAIQNKLGVFDWDIVKKAIEFEVSRKGQVYFLHNRVVDIHFVQKKVKEILPNLNTAILHGQMHSDDIARVMNAFCNGKVDLLLCTTIIENGLDIPNVNTLIVDDASRFGLSQLYQIRGRIGRSNVQAYAYFFYKSMVGNAEMRLDALMEAQDLGSGFLLANRDLEIRGVGNLLGRAQSGNISAVGYGLFMKYLGDAVRRLK